ncbi:MurR/RpiR family transcriptional regulator [Rhodobacteraceae bacterium RKSG542]|uniref:MurR/RpiR family transcriptional regulator n=1 Tax=Pseudovibrio flavus TaxID=2529854 RepID=UPI0012BC6F85|nr:MurR/RpiR family transcriptional regulator [Pseudovibrio flavus]MTI16453.1 MurR/RpiR family transcriptional regulator [Pseudovibrio flavus]
MSVNKNVDLLTELKHGSDSVSPAERRITELILEKPEKFIDLPMSQLAVSARVTEATLIRFCRRKGYEGLPDFRIALAQSLALARNFHREPTELSDPLSAHLEHITATAYQALDAVKASITPKKITKAAKLVLAARRIEVVGMGGASANVASETVNRLFRLGLTVSHSSDGYQQRMIAATLTPEDILIVFSASGELPLVLDTVRVAREAGARVISVTRSNSKLEEHSDLALTIEVSEPENILTPSPIRYSQLLLLDYLATAVAQEIGPDVMQRLRRVKETISNVITDRRNTPIGD